MNRSTALRRTPLRAPRRKKCRNPDCRQWFQPHNTLQRACSPRCAIQVARLDEAKERRAETRRMREKLKTRSDYLKEAQKAFNAWVRERDHDLPCISCGAESNDTALTGGYYDCGHYRSTGANPELRFEPLNAGKQCKRCNRDLSGNVANFRIGLRERIGDEKLDWLEGPHEPKHYTADDLKEIRDRYRRLARELKRKREAASDS